MKIDRETKEKPLVWWFKRFVNKKDQDGGILFHGNFSVEEDQSNSILGNLSFESNYLIQDRENPSFSDVLSVGKKNGEPIDGAVKRNRDLAYVSPINYSPEEIQEAINNIGNPNIQNELQTIIPVHYQIPMPDLLEVFKQYPQYTFFPVVDDFNRPQGIILEKNLKRFVYSRFGSTLLENPVLKNKLSDFIDPCTIVDICDDNEKILRTYSQSGTTEGIIVTWDSKYVGVISLRSLIKLGHERELSLQESHNRILEQKNNDINNILQNMKQGIFTILENGTIHHDYSTYVESIFETKDIEGKHYFDLLFKRSNISADKLSQIKSTIENSIGEDVLTFEVNAHLLVDEYQLRFEKDRVKHIELFWNPIVDKQETVKRFVVNIRDKTEIANLQARAIQQQKEFSIITQVFSISHDTFQDFIQSSTAYTDSCLNLLENNDLFSSEIIDHVFRNLHTIKGNSRLYGFDGLTDVVHSVEEVVNEVRTREIPYDNQKLKKEIIKISNTLDEYSTVIKNKLSGFLDKKQKGVFLDDQLFSSLSETVLNEECDDLLDSVQTIIKAKRILSAHNTLSLTSVFQDIYASVESMAKIVGKPRPHIYVNNNRIRLTRENASILKIVLMHSIRNSLSHGIEDSNTRQTLGKPEKGNIYLVAKLTEEYFRIEYWDDGAGLDLKKIMLKARESGIIKIDKPLGARQAAEFIFCPGLSTAGKVTEIAGRGVGMDAVQKAMNSVGGSIDIMFKDKKALSPDKRPFKFIFQFPVECAQVLD